MRPICFVCQNVDCKLRGAEQLMREITNQLAARSIDAEVKSYLCFGACDRGPNIVVYPQKCWYTRVQLTDVPEIVNSVAGGPAVVRLDTVERSLKAMIYDLLDTGVF
jgi:(2Fe-2S) ferredoxin